MIKLDADSTALAYPMDLQQDLEGIQRLIVLVSPDLDYTALTQRVWRLAHALQCQILFLSLYTDETQESSLRRQLITMTAMVQDGQVCAETRLETGSNWVHVVASILQNGDMIVCFAEQRVGLFQRPLSQILQSELHATVYILSGFHPEAMPRPNWFSQFMAWSGSVGIIAILFLLQVQITSLRQDWTQTSLLILSVIGEIWLISFWNSLFQ